jgi:hypothetical protein
MPFDAKKPKRLPGPPDFRQERIFSSVDRAFAELSSVLLNASHNHAEMRAIIAQMQPHVAVAKAWVLEN